MRKETIAAKMKRSIGKIGVITQHTLLVMMMMFSLNTFAQADSLLDYLDIAEMNNPGLQSAFVLYQASMERIPQMTGFEPLQFDVGIFTPPMHAVDGEQVAQFQLMQMFHWFGTRRAARTEMEHMANMAYEQFRETRDQLRLDVSIQWWTLCRLYRQLANNRENKQLLIHLEELALRRFATPAAGGSAAGSSSGGMTTTSVPVTASSGLSNMGGMSGMAGMSGMGNATSSQSSTPTSQSGANMGSMSMMSGDNMSSMGSGGMSAVLRIQMEIAEIDNAIESLLSEINAETAKFNAFLGRPAMTELQMPDTLTQTFFEFDETALIEMVRIQHPMLNMFLEEESAYTAKSEMDKRMSYPMIGIGVQYMLNKKIHHVLSGDPSMNGKDMIMPMASITIPIFRGQYRAQQRESIYLRQASRQNYENTFNMLQAELHSIKGKLENANRRIALYRRQTDIATTLHNLALQEFVSGQGDLTSVIQAQRQLLDLELMSVEAIADYNIMVAQIQKLVSLNDNSVMTLCCDEE